MSYLVGNLKGRFSRDGFQSTVCLPVPDLSSSGSRDFDVQTTRQRYDLKANLWYVYVV